VPQIFTYFEKSYESVRREVLLDTLIEFGIRESSSVNYNVFKRNL